jgi:hypothetical protein
MENTLSSFFLRNRLCFVILFIFSSCSLLERTEYDFAVQQVNEKEIVVDFTEINFGPWDTLVFLSPYATSEQIGLGYLDSRFLAQRAVNDGVIISGFLEQGDLKGYSSCPRAPVDFDQILGDSVFIKKIPRSVAVFSFIKHEDGVYRLKK